MNTRRKLTGCNVNQVRGADKCSQAMIPYSQFIYCLVEYAEEPNVEPKYKGEEK